jgi:hypothetical protein
MSVALIKRIYRPMSGEPWVFNRISILHSRAKKLDDHVGIGSTHTLKRQKAVSLPISIQLSEVSSSSING